MLALLLMLLPEPCTAQQVPDSVAQLTAAGEQSPTVHKRMKRKHVTLPAGESLHTTGGVKVVNVAGDTLHFASLDSIKGIEGVEIISTADSLSMAALGKKRIFNPSPTRALWLSALCPGLGQIYNRRYWKLPIVIGAFVGLSYGTTWNNRMYNDYTKAYRDATDNDPETRSYMNFYPPTTQESSLDMEWLKKALKNKKDYYRRYRDICIISMVGVYALCMIDAYVDAQLAHFDITPDLSMKVRPAVVDPGTPTRTPTLGVQCAFNF